MKASPQSQSDDGEFSHDYYVEVEIIHDLAPWEHDLVNCHSHSLQVGLDFL